MNSIVPTTLLFIRHGETDANVNGQLEGATDRPLNATGQAQAQALAARLLSENRPIQVIYSSSLTRARQTAAALATALGELPVQVDPDLSEYRLGEWDGLTLEELRDEKQMWVRTASDPHFAPPGGESAMQFGLRLVRAVRAILSRHPGQTVAIFSHGGALATVLALLLENQGNRWPGYQMDNCGISEVVFEPAPRLVRMNDVGHIGEMLNEER
ncbi:MAG: histidine phosphatase family protein [Anaerolineae bacterium]|jgi:probable phosphoglycerate mutase|uniref:histidine phosphatase family protein n=1 Tax=Candidatus Amarolinea dominans TaxID=3140696 RepID=UPI001D891B83|nr:histidine phosphatase family protein [Anaerolineae bacterium]MBK7200836.1 histidine phosphatase family protein [Anaerolineae bacterium]MBK9093678.1 histidine phosphatase family protein [Anaerolineae bacterium]MBK9234202.1 histidine phosphatase family protein [Anaerolineae bacterium]